jgi:hypothetical protein
VIEGLSYYPNPVVDKVSVSAKNEIEVLSVYTILGQEVEQFKPNSDKVSLDMTYYAPGIYIMEIMSNGETGVYKLIRQ